MTTRTVNYRVIAILTNDFGAYNRGKPSDISETIKWSGTNLDELSRKYPPSNIFGADPLGHSEIEDGLIRYDYRFEQQSEDGSWEKISDPRRRITPMTTLEREIDAENRRLYPGDYITEDEDDYGYDDEGYYCANCHDAGCSKCDLPEQPCNRCGNRFEAWLLTKDGFCSWCEEHGPFCVDCGAVKVNNDGDVCSYCQVWRRQ